MSTPRSTYVPKQPGVLDGTCQNVASKTHGDAPVFSLSVQNAAIFDYWQDEIGDVLFDDGEPMTLE